MGSEPEYLVCLNCETPSYTFEWDDGKIRNPMCTTCGNDDATEFLTPQEFEEEG